MNGAASSADGSRPRTIYCRSDLVFCPNTTRLAIPNNTFKLIILSLTYSTFTSFSWGFGVVVGFVVGVVVVVVVVVVGGGCCWRW